MASLKKFYLLILAFTGILLGGPVIQADESDAIFDDTVIHRIDIWFAEENYLELLQQYEESETYLACTMAWEGEVLDASVGIRIKGNSSSGVSSIKKSYKIDINEYGDQTLFGVKKINLNNSFKDPTLMRDKLGMELFGLYLKAPRVSYANLYINDQLFSLYQVVEQIDDEFLDRHWGSDAGNLYKGDPQGNLVYKGTDPALYQTDYEKQTHEEENDWSDLIELCELMNSNPPQERTAKLEPIFDIDAAIWYVALCNVLANLDSYVGSGHNYYIYDRPTDGKFEMIPWDLNEVFGNFPQNLTADQLRNLNIYYMPSVGGARPMSIHIYSDPPLKEPYLQCLYQLVTGPISPASMEARIDELAALIGPSVQADPNKLYSYEQFQTNLEEDVNLGDFQALSLGLKRFVTERTESILSQIGTPAPTYTITPTPTISQTPTQRPNGNLSIAINEFMASNASTISDEQGDYDDWIELYNPGQIAVQLGGMFLSDDLNDSTKWEFPQNTWIQPHGFLIIWTDGEPEEGAYHTTYKLSASGEEIGLFDTLANGNGLIDGFSFGIQETDVSQGRIPDGSGPIQTLETPSPGESNQRSATLTPTPTLTPGTGESPTPLPADINEDGHVNDQDLFLLYKQWHRGDSD